jgi:hypothetical protein
LSRHVCRWEVVHNYGMGTVLLAVVDDHSNIAWQPGHNLANYRIWPRWACVLAR